MNPILPLDYLLPILAVALAGGVFGAWRSTAQAIRPVRLAVTAARLGALLALGAIALNPGTWRREIKNENSEWALLLDRSASMAVPDVEGETRWSRALQWARAALQAGSRAGQARLYTLSSQLEAPLPDIERAGDMQPDGEGTDLAGSLMTLLERAEGHERRLAGVVLISDGRQLAPASDREPALLARAMDTPLYALCTGGQVAQKDLAVTAQHRQHLTFSGQTIRLAAHLENRGLGDLRVRVRLLEEDGRALAEQQVDLADRQNKRVEFEYRAGASGYRLVRLETDPWPGEAGTLNNGIQFGVRVLDGKINLLFVEGSPHWDTKFLLQSLRRQPHLQLTTVYRVTGERFFRIETGEEGDMDPRHVFPESQAELNRYDMVAFGKGAEFFLTPERLALLRAYLQDQGGAVIFCRGKPYFGTFPGLEPIEPLQWGDPLAQAFRWQPTLSGEQMGLFDGLLPARDDPVWAKTALAAQATACRQLNPFAVVLAEGVADGSDSRRVPLLASRRIGKGLSVVVNSEGLWRWDFNADREETGAFFQEFWIALFQWVAGQAEIPPGQQIGLRLQPEAVYPGLPVKAVVAWRGDLPEPAPEPQLQIWDRDRRLQVYTPRAARDNPGEWTAIMTAPSAGMYRVTAVLQPEDGSPAATAALEVLHPAVETDDVSADPAFLARLAEGSGGRLIAEKDLREVVAGFEPREVITESGASVWQPRWDRAWLLMVIAGLLAVEWFVRRRNGLL